MSATTSNLTDVIRSRRSPRQFLPTPMSPADIRGVLEDAQSAPSNSNTQPWMVHIFSGAARAALSDVLVNAYLEGRRSPDFTDTYGDGIHAQRAQMHAAVHYGVRGIERSDAASRQGVIIQNLRFYGAPHAALLFMPQLGDGVRTAGDVGMYAQNFLLSLTARGFHGLPQTILGQFATAVREHLGLTDDLKLLFGISFGTADLGSPLSSLDQEKLPVEHSVVLHDTPGVL